MSKMYVNQNNGTVDDANKKTIQPKTLWIMYTKIIILQTT